MKNNVSSRDSHAGRLVRFDDRGFVVPTSFKPKTGRQTKH